MPISGVKRIVKSSGLRRIERSWRGGFSLNSRSVDISPSVRSISATVTPDAKAPPTIEPMLVPATQSMGTRSSSSTLSTPTCAAPRAPPPESTRQTRGRFASEVWAKAGGAATSADTTPIAASAASRKREHMVGSFVGGGRVERGRCRPGFLFGHPPAETGAAMVPRKPRTGQCGPSLAPLTERVILVN